MDRAGRDPQRSAAGKLRAAARHWVEKRQGGSDELDDDLKAFNLEDQIKVSNEGPFGIRPENWDTVRAFLDLSGSWVRGTTADGQTILEMDRGKIKNTLELMGVKRREWPDVFNGLKVMETEAIQELFGEAK